MSVRDIIKEFKKTDQYAGVEIEYKFPKAGPPSKNDLIIQLSSTSFDDLKLSARSIRDWASNYASLEQINDSAPKPGIDWQIEIRRDDASRFNADTTMVGNTIQFMTNGLKLADIYLMTRQKRYCCSLSGNERDIGRLKKLRVKQRAV